MSLYTNLIAFWPTVQAATPGQTTAQRIAYYNALTVANTAAAGWTAPGSAVASCIVFSELETLAQANRMEIWAMLALPFALPGGNTSPLGMLAVLMPSGTCPLTYANFVALAQTVAGSEPRWKYDGLTAPINTYDTTAAGLI